MGFIVHVEEHPKDFPIVGVVSECIIPLSPEKGWLDRLLHPTICSSAPRAPAATSRSTIDLRLPFPACTGPAT
jgi:hypothetical protein